MIDGSTKVGGIRDCRGESIGLSMNSVVLDACIPGGVISSIGWAWLELVDCPVVG